MKQNHTRRGRRAVHTAILASATFTRSTAAAADFDSKLAVIHEAVNPRTAVLRQVLRMSAAPQGGQQQDPIFTLNIAGGPLRDVTAALAKATGNTITIGIDSIGPIYSPGVSGTFTFEQALKADLDSTNITFRLTSGTTAVLPLPSLSESVSVTGRVGHRRVAEVHPRRSATSRRRSKSSRARRWKRRASPRSARRCATCRASRCRPAKAAAPRAPPATCSTCAASTPRTACSSTTCATTGWCRAMSSTSSRSKCSWGRPARTSAAARPPAT